MRFSLARSQSDDDMDLFSFQVRSHGGVPHEFARSTDASSTTKTQKSYLADNRAATSSVNRQVYVVRASILSNDVYSLSINKTFALLVEKAIAIIR